MEQIIIKRTVTVIKNNMKIRESRKLWADLTYLLTPKAEPVGAVEKRSCLGHTYVPVPVGLMGREDGWGIFYFLKRAAIIMKIAGLTWIISRSRSHPSQRFRYLYLSSEGPKFWPFISVLRSELWINWPGWQSGETYSGLRTGQSFSFFCEVTWNFSWYKSTKVMCPRFVRLFGLVCKCSHPAERTMQEFKLVLSVAESSSISTVLLDLLCFFLRITSGSGERALSAFGVDRDFRNRPYSTWASTLLFCKVYLLHAYGCCMYYVHVYMYTACAYSLTKVRRANHIL